MNHLPSSVSIYCFSDWTAVERGVRIPRDLETTPLQIKTDSTLDSGDEINVPMRDKENTYISSVLIKFSSPMQYRINTCNKGYKDLPVQPPVEVEKTWTITKTGTSLNITCNNVEVLNYLFADSSDDRCVPKLGGNIVEKINFAHNDTASDFYKEGKIHFDLIIHSNEEGCK